MKYENLGDYYIFGTDKYDFEHGDEVLVDPEIIKNVEHILRLVFNTSEKEKVKAGRSFYKLKNRNEK